MCIHMNISFNDEIIWTWALMTITWSLLINQHVWIQSLDSNTEGENMEITMPSQSLWKYD